MRLPLRRAACAVATAVLATGLAAGPALADVVTNDITNATETLAVAVGGTAPTTLTVSPRQDDGVNGCNLKQDGTVSFTVTTSDAAVATVSPSTVTFTDCGAAGAQQLTVTGASAGSVNVSLTESSNNTGGTFDTGPATFTVDVSRAVADNPPSVAVTGFTDGDTFELGRDTLPTPGCSATDTEDGLSTPVPSVTDNRDQWGLGAVSVGCSYTDEGGQTATSSASFTVVDTTDPTATFAGRTAANTAGWNNEPVTVTWTCSDSGSGVVSDTASATVTTEGADQTASATCTDHAGNTTTAQRGDIDVDLTPPSVTWTGGPADGASYYYGSVPAQPTCTAADSLSGPAGCEVVGHGGSVGSHTMTATGSDVADNTTVETRTYDVLAWTLSGFYRPVDAGGVWNVVKNGATVPLKFEVFAGDTELTTSSVVSAFTATQVSCEDGSTNQDAVETTTTGGTSLRYDSTGGQFVQNWQTPKKAGACYRVVMRTQDGSSLEALFKLR